MQGLSKDEVDKMKACCMFFSPSPILRPHKEPVSAIQVTSVRSLRAARLLEMRKLDIQFVVVWVSYGRPGSTFVSLGCPVLAATAGFVIRK